MGSYNFSPTNGNRNPHEASRSDPKRQAASRRVFHEKCKADPGWSRNTIRVPIWLIEYDLISAGAKAVAMLLLCFPDKRCYPSEKYLAQRLGSSVRQVKRWIAELNLAGIIKIQRARRQNSRYLICRYDKRNCFALVPREIVESPLLHTKSKVLAAAGWYCQGDSRFTWRPFREITQIAGLTKGSAYRAFHELEKWCVVTIDKGGLDDPWDYDPEDQEKQLMVTKFGRRTITFHRSRVLSVYPIDTLSSPSVSPLKPEVSPPVSPQDSANLSAGVPRIRSVPDQDNKTRSDNKTRAPLRVASARDSETNLKSIPEPRQAAGPAYNSHDDAKTYRERLIERCRAREADAEAERQRLRERKAKLIGQGRELMAKADADVPQFDLPEPEAPVVDELEAPPFDEPVPNFDLPETEQGANTVAH
jgi:hypothetical protein